MNIISALNFGAALFAFSGGLMNLKEENYGWAGTLFAMASLNVIIGLL